MFEVPTDAQTRDAIRRAHEERARVIADAWNWLTTSRKSREAKR